MGAVSLVVIGVLLIAMIAGSVAQLILGKANMWTIDWPLALGAGVVGSLVGGLLFHLIFDHEFVIRPSGLIGSLVGAIIVTAAYTWFRKQPAK